MASKAIQMANELHTIIHKNCDVTKPLEESFYGFDIYISLGALACETYFKSIIYYHNKHNGRRVGYHQLDRLFKAIPDDERLIINNNIPGIENCLKSISNAYVDLRYVFELNAFNKAYLVIFELMDTLHEIVKKYDSIEYPLLSYSSSAIKIE